MKSFLLLTLAALLTGCGTTSTIREAKIAIPIRCKAEVPTRPIMPTDAVRRDLPDDRLVYEFAKAAAAEIELRDGYEARLVAALNSCL